ncbi:ATP-dependent DNA helicase RecG [Candidatus Falkowbacteria bacterium HGW-Falkowbacteria-1]|jgi:ATP-dependent DNA helicase RecG|uniref:ATP-dependent DNA helicase RecG n=1 Tax=Candidatus Falkowbacteria bacterium HGW-Falkowbacteria-1 TaxID=2013768 RepID=A0A2N2EAG1_9BACT|nr:MAG: ATP-dependent DNA helicase RecG [Candidatus Falkowbacteria bacterium HGW-Falkowbacteria-1]
MENLEKNIKTLPKIGDKTEKKLEKMGIKTINDLIFHFPFRYEKYEFCENLGKIKINTAINLKVKIDLIRNKRSFRKKMTISEAIVSDDHGSLEVIWFNQPFISKTLKNGDMVSLAGKIMANNGRLIMASPIYEKINQYSEPIHTKGIVPIYNLTSGLTQKQLRFFIKKISPNFLKITEYLPKETLERQSLININLATEKIHFPKKDDDIEKASEYFKFLELFLFQLKSYFLKKELETKRAEKLEIKLNEIKKFILSLPFELTDDQKKSSWEILKDIEKNNPMSRLLQGDVGSGKTIVALIAILNCLLNKKQAIFMAPTEILATQHYKTALKLLEKYNFKIALLSSQKKESNFELLSKNKKDIQQIICQQADLIIGTHSLISENIHFKNLSLVVIDEQHRFGVSQRQEILKKNLDDNKKETTPHFLSMTATPIPRSLSLVLFNGSKLSSIKTKPKNRLDIKTEIVSTERKNKMYEFINQEIKNGRQAFIICPLIEEIENSEIKSVKEEYQKLKKNIFPEIEMSILHGKMKATEKEQIMSDFLANKIKIIISTSVIEVGIDVPNATIMLIEGAERFGLAQLHQFRGRVGRGEYQSYCFLSLSETKNDTPFFDKKINYSKSTSRLEALKKYQNGLDLAKIDLKNRGSGNIYGKIQSGFTNFKFASIFDYETIKKSRDEIELLSQSDPNFEKYPLLLKKITKNIEETHLE